MSRRRLPRRLRTEVLERRELLAAEVFEARLDAWIADGEVRLTGPESREAIVQVGQVFDLAVSYRDLRDGGHGAFAFGVDLAASLPDALTPALTETQRLVVPLLPADLSRGRWDVRVGDALTRIPIEEFRDDAAAALQSALVRLGYGPEQVAVRRSGLASGETLLEIRYRGSGLIGVDVPPPSLNLIAATTTNQQVRISATVESIDAKRADGSVNPAAVAANLIFNGREAFGRQSFEAAVGGRYDATFGLDELTVVGGWSTPSAVAGQWIEAFRMPVYINRPVASLDIALDAAEAPDAVLAYGDDLAVAPEALGLNGAGSAIAIQAVGSLDDSLINEFYFSAIGDSGRRGLYVSDGVTTRLIADESNGVSLNPAEMVYHADRLYFTAADGRGGRELFATDGASSVKMVADLSGTVSSNPLHLTVVGDDLYFTARRIDEQRELYVLRGSSQRVEPLGDLNESTSSQPGNLTAVDSRLFFTAVDSDGQRELYVSDGSDVGTRRVHNISGSMNSDPADMVPFGDELFFTANYGQDSNGQVLRRLYRTDGTASGTRVVLDGNRGGPNSNPRSLLVFDDHLFFIRTDADGVDRMYRSDAAGSPAVIPSLAGVTEIVSTGARLYAAASLGNQTELYAASKFDSPMTLVRDVSGRLSSDPRNLTAINRRLAYTAALPSGERELFHSAGTARSTSLVANLSATTSADPSLLTAVGNRMAFLAEDENGKFVLHFTGFRRGNTVAIESSLQGPFQRPSQIVAGGLAKDQIFANRTGSRNAAGPLTIATPPAAAEFQIAADTNGDGTVSAIDALLVVNSLRQDALSLSSPISSESRLVTSGDISEWQEIVGSDSQLDVNQDGTVSAIDALLVINSLRSQSSAMPIEATPKMESAAVSRSAVSFVTGGYFADGEGPFQNAGNPMDVDGDGVVSLLDPLRLINELHRQQASAGGEALAGMALDVSGNGRLEPRDAILALNEYRTARSQIAVALSHDTAEHDDTPLDRRTHDLGITGGISRTDSRALFVSLGDSGDWVDASAHVGADGRFEITDAALRSLLSDAVPLGQTTVRVAGDAAGSGIQELTIDSLNRPPRIEAVPNQTMTFGQTELIIPVTGFDPDGDPLQWFGFATVENPLHQVRETYGLREVGEQYFNLSGLSEKWLFSDNGQAYLLMPNGDMVRWAGDYESTAVRETLEASLGTEVYDDPTLLTLAAPRIAASASVTVTDGAVTITPQTGSVGTIRVTVLAGDAENSSATSFDVTIDPPDSADARIFNSIESIRRAASDLEMADVPEFIAQIDVALVEGEFDDAASASLQGLQRQLATLHNQWFANQDAADAWNADQLAAGQRDLAHTEAITAELDQLIDSFEAALVTQASNLGVPQNPNPSLAPIFVTGVADGQVITLVPGQELLLDLTAIHPTGLAHYQYEMLNHDLNDPALGYMIRNNRGEFHWYPDSATSGEYQFRVTVETLLPSAARSIEFTVRFAPPPQPSFTTRVHPPVITDGGNDRVRVDVIDASVPGGALGRVDIYQDTNDNGVWDMSDMRLATDEDPVGGWGDDVKPVVTPNQTSIRLFAKSRALGFTEFDTDDVGVVDIAVTPTLRLDAPALEVAGPVEFLYASWAREDRLIAKYGAGNAVILDYGSSGIVARRLTNVTAANGGTPVGGPISLPVTGRIQGTETMKVVADAMGNALIISEGSIQQTDGQYLPAIVGMRLPAGASSVEAPVVLAQATAEDGFSDLAASVSVNDAGQGVVTWQSYFFPERTYFRTLSTLDAPLTGTLGSIQRLDFASEDGAGGELDVVVVNDAGEFMIAYTPWIVRGNVADPAGFQVSAGIDYPSHAGILPDGRGVLVDDDAIYTTDDQGNLIGTPYPVPGSYPRSFEIDGNDITLRWGNNPIQSQRYSFGSQQPVSFAASPIVVGLGGWNAGGLDSVVSADIQVSIQGVGDANPTPLAVYLSHDDVIDDSDRLISLTQTPVLVEGQTTTLNLLVDVPPSEDPFWNHGNTDLRLIASLPNNGQQATSTVGYVNLDPVQAFVSGTAVTSFDVAPTPYFPAPLGARDWIDPAVATDQLGAAATSNVDQMRLIGRQFIAAADQLAASTQPWSPLRNAIDSVARDMQARIDALLLQTLLPIQAQQAAADSAQQRLNETIAAANRDANEDLAGPLALAKQLVDSRDSRLDEIRASRATRIVDTRNRLSASIATIDADLAAANASAESVERLEQQYGPGGVFSLYRPAGEHTAFGLNPLSAAVGCASDPLACGRDLYRRGGDYISTRYQTVRDAAIELRSQLVDQLDHIAATVGSEINRAISRVNSEVNSAVVAFNDLRRGVLRTRDEFIAQAEAEYRRSIDELSSVMDEVTDLRAAALPAFERVGQIGRDATDRLREAGGVIDSLRNFDPQSLNPVLNSSTSASFDISQTYFVDTVIGGIVDSLDPAVAGAKSFAGEVADWVTSTGGRESNWTKKEPLILDGWTAQDAAKIATEPVIAYSVKNDFTFATNLQNASTSFEVEIGAGLSYDSRKLFEILEGKLSIPDLDPIEAISAFSPVRPVITNNYEQVRAGVFDEFGGQNVYFSSRRFVQKMGLGTAVEAAFETFSTAGQQAEDAFRDLADTLRLEMNDVLAWLQIRGEQQLDSLVPDLMRSILYAQPIVLPHMEIRWTPVTFNYELQLNPAIGQLASLVEPVSPVDFEYWAQQLLAGLPLDVDVNQGGFAIIWTDPTPGDSTDPSAIDADVDGYLDEFDFDGFSGELLDARRMSLVLADLIGDVPDEVGQLLQLMTSQIAGASQFENQFATRIADALGIDRDLIQLNRDRGEVIINLLGTSAATNLESLLNPITFGNQGKARLTRMELNLTNFSIDIAGTLCHEHSWGSIADVVDRYVS
ncbi:dockerin type I domain-containing protein [Rubripirellula amarantea]|nr:dockerin type I domain-containing protein [Rubripirellula amarantea]